MKLDDDQTFITSEILQITTRIYQLTDLYCIDIDLYMVTIFTLIAQP